MNRFVILLAALAAAAAVVELAPAARASETVVKLSGGGKATFDADPDNGTIFSIEAQIDATGTPRGHFFCAIPGMVAIVGDDLRGATINADGSVTLTGFAHGFDVFVGVFTDMPFEVRLWAGGPGVGRFWYDDPVLGTALVGTDVEGDHETVAAGQIKITGP